MPSFQYLAYGAHGQLSKGQIDAASLEAAEGSLWSQNLVPFKLKEISEHKVAWWRRELFPSSAPRRADLALFTREFSELYGSGIPLDDCVRILSDQATTEGMRRISMGLLDGILDGSSLADAMQKQSTVFPLDYLNVVRAGEMSGTLDQAFEELADLMEQRAAIDARIRAALAYPAILMVLAVISIAIVVGVLIPSISPIFEENGKPVPSALRVLMVVQSNWILLLFAAAGIACLVLGVATFIRRSPARRLRYDGYKLRLPGIGALILHEETARFARTLGTLLKAGVPLLQAATSAQTVVRNRLISSKIERAVGFVREGSPLSSALRSEDVFPQIVLRMISVGEETAKLDKMLLRAAAMFEVRTQRTIDHFMSLLTPALTVVIAALVGGLVLTVMNAILSINELAIK